MPTEVLSAVHTWMPETGTIIILFVAALGLMAFAAIMYASDDYWFGILGFLCHVIGFCCAVVLVVLWLSMVTLADSQPPTIVAAAIVVACAVGPAWLGAKMR